jgi:hypothetical protein
MRPQVNQQQDDPQDQNDPQQGSQVDAQDQDTAEFDDPEADATFAKFQEAERLKSFDEAATTIRTAIPLDTLVVSGQFQIRQALTESFVKRYVAAYEVGAEMPPVEVAIVRGTNGEPIYYLVDGFHRVEALARLGRTEVDAQISELPSLNAVLWEGWKRNQHGVHYTKDERVTAFKLYLSMGQHLYRPRAGAALELKSIRQIGKEWFRSPATMWKMICKLDKKLAQKYKLRSHGRLGRDKTGEGNPAGRQLAPLDVARRDLKNVLNIAKGEARASQVKILSAAETMVAKLKSLDNTPITAAWHPTGEDF